MGRGGILRTLCEKGEVDRALDVLLGLDTPNSANIYLSLLKACCKNKALASAKRLHAHLHLHRVPLAGSLGDHLVVTLAKCGAIEDAQLVSRKLPHLSVLAWTALVSSYADHGQGHEALRMHQCMLEDNVQPNNYTYVSLFKACGSIPDLAQGMKFHADAHRKDFASNVFAGNTLISMYGKCGAMAEAEHVFGAMSERTAVSWNAMLSAFVEQGQVEEALWLYTQMHHECVSADQGTCVITLQACAILGEKEDSLLVEGSSTKPMSMEIGQALHADIRKKGIVADAFVASTLVSMYGKCGAIVEAEHVFGALPQPTVVSWNAMLTSYVEHDQGERALGLYTQIQEKGVSPDQATYVVALQACATLAEKEDALDIKGTTLISLEIGQALHADIHRKGFMSHVFVGNTVVSMYGKCGALVDAEHVFGALSQHTIMSWNAMLSVYIEQGQAEKALRLYMQMQEGMVNPDQRTLVIVLHACITLAEKEEAVIVEGQAIKVMSFEIGQALHADARKNGFESNAFVSSTLVSMYGVCGAIVGAEIVFGALSDRDIVTWNAMFSAYVEQGHGEKALLLYTQMQEEGVTPDQRTFVVILQACAILAEKEETLLVEGRSAKVMSLNIGRALHADAGRIGLAFDVFVGNTLISMYGKCGAIMEAQDVFGALSQRDIVSWNAMVSAYVEQGQREKALRLYRQMQKQCVTHVTLSRILQACSETGSLEICKQLHFEVVSAGYDQISSVVATLISAYGGCASMVDAQAIFDELSELDIASWNACIAGHAGEGCFVSSFHKFEDLKHAGIKPDEVTFILVISACARTGLVVKGLEYFESMSRDYGICPDMKHYGSMLDLLGRAGDFKRIEYILEKMPMQADVTLWLCLLGACTHGNLELATWAFNHAVSLQPKHTTAYVLMSNIYAAAGLQECAAEVENSRQDRSVKEGWPELD